MLISSKKDLAATPVLAPRGVTSKSPIAVEPKETFVPSTSSGNDWNIGKGLAYGLLGGVGGAIPVIGGLVTGLGATLATEAATGDESLTAKKIALVSGTTAGLLSSCVATAAAATGDWRGLALMGLANAATYFYAGANLPSDL